MAPHHPTIEFDPENRFRMSIRVGLGILVAVSAAVWGYATVTGKLDALSSDVATLKEEQRKMAKDLSATSATVQQFIGYANAKNGVSALHLPKLLDELPPPSP